MNKEELICALMDESNDDWNLEEYKQFVFETIAKADDGVNVFPGLMRYITKGYAFVICTDITDTNYMEIAIYTNGTVVSVLRIVSSAVITCGDDAIMNEIERRITEYERG